MVSGSYLILFILIFFCRWFDVRFLLLCSTCKKMLSDCLWKCVVCQEKVECPIPILFSTATRVSYLLTFYEACQKKLCDCIWYYAECRKKFAGLILKLCSVATKVACLITFYLQTDFQQNIACLILILYSVPRKGCVPTFDIM